jgi:head-tail adaptor
MSPAPVATAGQRRHLVTFQNPGAAVATPDGAYAQTWTDLAPPALWMTIQPATARALEQISAGAVLGIATHLLTGPYHPQIAAKTRALYNGHTFEVTHVQNPDMRNVEVVIVAVEVLGEAAAPIVPPVPTYADLVIADGAAHYWRLHEANGTVAQDSVGGLHGTIIGAVSLDQPGVLTDDAAMAFAAGGRIQTAAPVPIPTPYTLEIWIQQAARNNNAVLMSARLPGAGTEIVAYVGPDGVVQCYIGSGITARGAQILSLVAWHHVVVVLTGTTIEVYLDAVADVMTPSAFVYGGSAGRALEFACDTAGTGELNGRLDEIALYPRALTAQEVAAHYQAAPPPGRRGRRR